MPSIYGPSCERGRSMRVLTIRHDTDLEGLKNLLLDARLSSTRASATLDVLQATNPHIDLKDLPAGTVLFVPETSGFKASASVSVQRDALRDFEQLLRDALGKAADKLKAG